MRILTLAFVCLLGALARLEASDVACKAVVDSLEDAIGKFKFAHRTQHAAGLGSSATYFYTPNPQVNLTVFIFDHNLPSLPSDAARTEFSDSHKRIARDYAKLPGFVVDQAGPSSMKLENLPVFEGIYSGFVAADGTKVSNVMIVTGKNNRLFKIAVTCASKDIPEIRKEIPVFATACLERLDPPKAIALPDGAASKLLLGEWGILSDGRVIEGASINFNEDGTFGIRLGIDPTGEEKSFESTGKWTITHGVLTKEVTAGTSVGSIGRATLISLTETEFRTRDDNGIEHRCVRLEKQ